MLKITKVPMTRRYDLHDIAFDIVEVQEPNAELYMKFGKPQEYLRTAADTLLHHTHSEVVKAYLDECIIAPVKGGGLPLAAIDMIRVEKALVDFFIEPEKIPAKQTKVLTEPSTTSSSPGDGDQ